MALDYTYMFTGSSVFVHAGGQSWLIGRSEPKYEKVVKLIKDQEPLERLKEVLDEDDREGLRGWCEEQLKDNKAGITIGESTVEIDGEPVYGGLCRQIIEMHADEIPLEPLVNFVRKMRQNPSYRIRQQLWGFIEACQSEGGFTLHSDGDIMAYKVVSENFTDCHSGTFDNHPGCIVEMPREAVDDDPSHTCSAGLHFCAYSYVKAFSSFGTRLVLVKVNPKDVVSIPEDYGCAKARCCRYEVVEEIDAPLRKPVYSDDEDADEEGEDSPEGIGVYRTETYAVHGCPVRFVFRHPQVDGGIGYSVGDVVEAWFRDYYDSGYHIGVILEKDEADKDLTWKIGFFDHDTKEWTEWWVNGDSIHYPEMDDAERECLEWFSRLDDECPDEDDADDADDDASKDGDEAFSVGDAVRIHMLDGKIATVCDIVKRASANGETMYHVRWTEDDGGKAGGYFIEELLEPVDGGSKKDKLGNESSALEGLESILKEMCGKAGIDYGKIRSLAEDLADTVLKDKDEEEDGNAEFFVESWLDDAGRKKAARFLEARCSGLMNGSLDVRLALSGKEYDSGRVKRLLGKWMKEQIGASDEDDEDRVWKVLRTMMQSWDRHGK